MNPNACISVDVRAIARTPSLTPSEVKELVKKGVFDSGVMMKWRYWVRRAWLCE